MENAADALKIAFAILVFMMGISILFSLASSLRQSADDILYYSDGTNFYAWESGTGKSCRIVQEKDVIASLYNENNSVKISIYKNGQEIYSSTSGEITNNLINKELNEGNMYFEQIFEETSSGQYVYANDGTRIRTGLGKTVLHIIYIKQ